LNNKAVDIKVSSNKNLDGLQETFGFSDEVKQGLITEIPGVLAENFARYPQVLNLFTRDANKASQFIYLKLIAKTLSYDITYQSDADGVIHISGGERPVANVKIYETPEGQQLISKTISLKRSLDDYVEDGSSRKIAKTDDIEVGSKRGFPIEFGQGNSFVQDFHHNVDRSPAMKALQLITPKFTIEWNDKSSAQNLLLDQANAQESSINSYQATIGLKAADASVDVAKLVYEPTFNHANELFRDAVHIGAMVTGFNGYVVTMSMLDISNQVYQGEYMQALTQAGTAALYMALPTPIIFAYTGYKAAENLYSFYSYYGTPEAELKSNIAYANLADKFGSNEKAKEYLVEAMEIVCADLELYHDSDSVVQHVANEYHVLGKLYTLDPSYEHCAG
jgi:hypothetical protein